MDGIKGRSQLFMSDMSVMFDSTEHLLGFKRNLSHNLQNDWLDYVTSSGYGLSFHIGKPSTTEEVYTDLIFPWPVVFGSTWLHGTELHKLMYANFQPGIYLTPWKGLGRTQRNKQGL